eukprot:scaffold426_cov219-Amphora_coffeaeformis.AAC.17
MPSRQSTGQTPDDVRSRSSTCGADSRRREKQVFHLRREGVVAFEGSGWGLRFLDSDCSDDASASVINVAVYVDS